jgi:hypothetical protein
MSRWLSPRLAPAALLFLLALSGPPRWARAQWNAPNPQNAPRAQSEDEESAVRRSVARLAQGIEARDAATWKLLRLSDTNASDVRNLSASLEVGRVGFSSDGSKALARYALTVAGTRDGRSVLVKQAVQDIALVRGDASWEALPQQTAWDVPDATMDALSQLSATARSEWDSMHGAAPSRAGVGGVQPSTAPPESEVLHLVAERRGGRWIGLRSYTWTGRVLSPNAIKARESTPNAIATNAAPGAQNGAAQWIAGQLGRWARQADGKGGGTLHLLLQNGARDWVGLDGVWEPRLSQAPEALASAASKQPRSDADPAPLSEDAAGDASSLRLEISDDPVLFGDAASHKKLAQVLEGAGLFGEAADEWEKAATLVPALARPGDNVSATRLAGAKARREWDPQQRSLRQLVAEDKVGLDANHPDTVLGLLLAKNKVQPTPMLALQIGLEYSKLGQDKLAASWLASGKDALQRGWRLSANDSAWADVLIEHLEQRTQLTQVKPPNLLSSKLFTVRCRLDDPTVLPVLAALEAAQHTVYGDFAIPMGSTEVVQWPDQSAFQSYTTRFSSQGASEFVAALTLTKLIATDSGPWVLGEEVNVFADPRLADVTFGTVAHEYGHVAVRQMSKGRTVPVWFNEGLATVVEGGYDGAIERVRTAARARKLLSMDALKEWNVDGERAFLAYSQANSMVDFVIATWGSQKVLDILRLIGQDVPPEQAFQNALGISTAQLWQRWARGGIR